MTHYLCEQTSIAVEILLLLINVAFDFEHQNSCNRVVLANFVERLRLKKKKALLEPSFLFCEFVDSLTNVKRNIR